MTILITAPSLSPEVNVSGISSVVNFIIKNNPEHHYIHFKLGKADNERGKAKAIIRVLRCWILWVKTLVLNKHIFIHFNFALDKRSIIRDAPLVLFSKLIRKQMIIHLHGGEYLHKENIPKWINFVLKLIFSGPNLILTLSKTEEEIIRKRYHPQRTTFLPNCIDLTEAKKYVRHYSNNKITNILFIGRIIERKGIETILMALKILKQRGIKFNYILAGTGTEQDSYIKRCSEILNDYFQFKGIVFGEKKLELLKMSDIFVLPSFSGEGLPIALLEAMSFGVVPIITDDGSMKEVIIKDENGFYVKKGDHCSLSETIEKLILNNTQMHDISRNASEYIFNNYNPDLYITRLNGFYKNTNRRIFL